jgi:hypothetical protein
MNPEDIKITNLNKLLVYEQQSRIIDKLDTEELKNFAKTYCKLYLQQQEVLLNLNLSFETL